MVHKITTTSESIELQTTNTSTNTAGMTLPSTTSPPNFFKPFLRPSTSDISLSTDGGAADISTTAPSTPSHEDHHDHDPRDRSHHHHHNNNNNTARCGRGRHLSSHIEDINEPYGLREQEKGWRFFQPFLQKRGYELRPRYWPGWMGSWIGKNVDPLTCEDSIVVVSTRSILYLVFFSSFSYSPFRWVERLGFHCSRRRTNLRQRPGHPQSPHFARSFHGTRTRHSSIFFLHALYRERPAQSLRAPVGHPGRRGERDPVQWSPHQRDATVQGLVCAEDGYGVRGAEFRQADVRSEFFFSQYLGLIERVFEGD